LGVFDYLVKPIIEDELTGVIKKFIACHGFSVAKSKVIEQVLDIIDKEYNQKISLETLAESVHVSPTYLSKKFSEEIGQSIPSFIMKFRIKKAKKLLVRYPDYSMAMVAELVGFHSQNYFTNIFKKYEGITPSKYRELKSDRYD
jgi:YesN/AraC family two-component response regulator